MTSPTTPDQPAALSAISHLSPRSCSWLWPRRLALGKLAILDGDPGLGKSLVALDLCARLSTGRPWPDGSAGPGPAASIVLNGEDADDILIPRFRSLAADPNRIFVLRPREDHDHLRFPTHTPLLRSAVSSTGARLVVIDPIMAFLDNGIISGNDQSIRRALFPLIQLAADLTCAILLVRHLNKTGRSHALYRGGGSIGLVGACRSAWLIAPDPLFPQRKVLAQVKNNLAPPQHSLTYELLTRDGLPELAWLGPSPLTADQLLVSPAPFTPVFLRDRAREFLAGLLESGPLTSRDIWTAAQEQGLTDTTLRRAKADLEARSVRIWADGQRLSYWLLPGQQLPDTIPTEAAPPDLEPWLAPLREKFPPATPLDEI